MTASLFELRPTHNPHRWRLPITRQVSVGQEGSPFMFGGIGLAHDPDHGLVQGGDVGKGPGVPGALGDPGRMLEDRPEFAGKFGLRQRAKLVQGHGGCDGVRHDGKSKGYPASKEGCPGV